MKCSWSLTVISHGVKWLLATLLAALLAPFLGFAQNEVVNEPRVEIRFAFSKAMFADVNENDAAAAMKVYTQTIGDQNGVYVASEPILLDGTNAIARAVESKRAEVFALTTDEFLAMEQLGLEGPFLCSYVRQTFTEVYLLLVREDSPLRQAEDLKGRSLIAFGDVRSCLAMPWLEVLCQERELGPAARLFGRITSSCKPMQVVLPVFFGKADACLITRNGYEVMCELNPQLKKQMRAIAVSPALLPALSCFSRGTSEVFKQKVFKAVELSAAKPSYRQLMTLFKADRVDFQPASALDGTRQLMARYHTLFRAGKGTKALEALQTASPKEAAQQLLNVLQCESIRPAPPSCLQSSLDLLALHDRISGGSIAGTNNDAAVRPAMDAERL